MVTKTNNQPLVSVIVITYNSAKYVLETLESIKKQTYKNIELIISDDGSNDQTLEICKKWINKNKKRFVHNELIPSTINTGIVRNYFRAIRKCRGKYIAQCAGDDFWTDNNKLLKHVEFLENNDEYGMVHTNADLYWEDSDKIIRNINNRINITDEDIFEELISKGIFIRPLTVLIKKDCIDNYLKEIDPYRWSIEDYPLFLYISKHYKVKYFNYSTAVYRRHDNAITLNKHPITRSKLLKGILDIELFFARKYCASQKIQILAEQKYHRRNIEIAFYDADYKRAEESFKYLKQHKKLGYKYLIMFYAAKYVFLRLLILDFMKLKNRLRKLSRKLGIA